MSTPDPVSDIVRCYACARRQPSARESCEACGAMFTGLCACGAHVSVYARVCGACSRTLTPKRLPRSRHPAVRLVRWGLVAVAAGTVAFVVWRRGREPEPWKLKDRGLAAFRENRYGDAVADFRRVIELTPRDASAWFNLAASYRQLQMSDDLVRAAAEKALELDAALPEAQLLLVDVERRAGRLDAALDRARRAARAPSVPPQVWEQIAELELLSPDGRPAAALDAVRTANSKGVDSTVLRALAAECYLRIYGALPADAYPPEAAAALTRARSAIEDALLTAPSPGGRLALARLQLSTGAWADAYGTADQALDAAPTDLEPGVRFGLLVARARSLLAWRGDSPEVRSDLLQALQLRRDAPAVDAVLAPLLAAGADVLADDVLSAALSGGGDAAELQLRLAALRVRRDRPEDALQLLGDGAAAEGARHALVRGDALAALRRDADAMQAYARASAASPDWVAPRLRRALVSIRGAADRPAAARAALLELEPLLQTPDVSDALLDAECRLALAAGDADRARRAAERLTAAVPGDPNAWVLLARAVLAAGAEDAATRAAVAYRRASELRPGDGDLAAEEVRSLLRSLDPAGALAAASRFLARVPGDTTILRLRAEAALVARQWAAAATDLTDLLARTPRDAQLRLLLAGAQAESGAVDDARRTLDSIDASADPEAAELAAVLRMRLDGRGAGAISASIRERGPSVAGARALYLAGDPEHAAAVARQVLADSPTDAHAIEIAVLAALDAAPGDASTQREADELIARLPPEAPAWMGPVLRARVLLDRLQWDAAYAEVAPVRAALPGRALPVFVCGAAAVRSGRTSEGIDALQRSLVLPGAPPGLPRAVADTVAFASYRRSEPAEAERLARFALALVPGHARATVRAADLLIGRGELARALSLLDAAMQTVDTDDETRFELRVRAAYAAAALGRAELAIVHTDRARALRPDSALVPFLSGQALLAKGRADDAEREFAAAEGGSPGFALARMGRVAAACARGDASAAAGLTADWDRSHPANPVTIAASRHVERTLGPRAALLVLEPASRERPEDSRVAHEIVAVHVRAGDPDAARRFAETWAGARGRDPAALVVLARATFDAPGGAAQAVTWLESALEGGTLPDADRTAATVLRAQALLRAGRLADARDAAQRAAHDVGSDVSAEHTLRCVEGLASSLLGDHSRAAAAFQRCVELSPTDADSWNNLAWSLVESGGTAAGAAEAARRAVGMRPADPSFWSTRARASEAAGDTADAIAALRRALELSGEGVRQDPAWRGRLAVRLCRLYAAAGRAPEADQLAAEIRAWRPAPPADVLADLPTPGHR